MTMFSADVVWVKLHPCWMPHAVLIFVYFSYLIFLFMSVLAYFPSSLLILD